MRNSKQRIKDNLVLEIFVEKFIEKFVKHLWIKTLFNHLPVCCKLSFPKRCSEKLTVPKPAFQ